MAIIGVIGIGKIGMRVCERLVHAGHRVHASDPRSEAQAAAIAAGAVGVDSAAVASPRRDFVFLCTEDAATLEDLSEGGGGILAAGAVLIDTTASMPSAVVRIGHALAERGVGMIDAPLNCVREEGRLDVMVGGSLKNVEGCRPLLEALGAEVHHVGALGAGSAMLALAALLHGSAMAATAEVLDVTQRSGISMEAAIDVFNVSSGRSYSSEIEFPALIATNGYDSGLTIGEVERSIRTGVEMAHEAGIQAPMAERLATLYALVLRRVGPDADNTVIARYVKVLSGANGSTNG